MYQQIKQIKKDIFSQNQETNKLKPYFPSTQSQKPSPLRINDNSDPRNRSENRSRLGSRQIRQEQSQNNQRRISPKQKLLSESSPHKKLQLDSSTNQISQADLNKISGQILSNQHSLTDNQLMRKSPSFRLKQFKKQFQRNPYIKKKDNNTNQRIVNLEQYLKNMTENQIEQDDIEEFRVENTKQLNQGVVTTTDYSTKFTLLDETENNPEEVHFLQVQFQQKCKFQFLKMELHSFK